MTPVNELLTMLTVKSSEARCTQTRAVNTPAIAAACRVLTLCVWHITLLTLPADMADTPTSTVVAVTAT